LELSGPLAAGAAVTRRSSHCQVILNYASNQLQNGERCGY